MKKKVILIIISVLYALFMVFALFVSNRGSIGNVSLEKYISSCCNFVPFATISEYISAILNHRMNMIIPVANLGGNFILFIPFAVIIYAFTKMKEGKFLIISLLLIFAIEVIQILTRTGSFDIDDFILNITGAAITYKIIYCICMNKETK